MFEALGEGVLIAASGGEVLDANPRACALLQRAREDLIGTGIFGREDIRKAAFAEPRTGRFEGEIRLPSGDGDPVSVEATFTVYRDGDEERVGIVLRNTAGTEEAVEAGQAAGHGAEGLLRPPEQTPEFRALCGTDGAIRYERSAVERVLGYGPGAFAGGDIRDHAHPEDRDLLCRIPEMAPERPGVRRIEGFRLRHADGSWRDFEGSIGKQTDDTGKCRTFVHFRDITGRKQVESNLRRSLDVLLALREAGHTLGSTLESEEIGTRLLEIMKRISSLTTAVVSVPDGQRRLRVWRAIGFESLWRRARYTPEAQRTLYSVLHTGERQTFRLEPPEAGGDPLMGLCLPLRRRSRVLGVLEIYGPDSLQEGDTVGILESLTGQAASALENARLYSELSEREHRLQELVGQLLRAQEEERRRVAYEVHDGLAQVAAAAHQHLQAFARSYSPGSGESRRVLEEAVELVHRTVGEARRAIAGLRPTALDDFGLQTALRLEVERAREEGWRVDYEQSLGDDERLPFAVETALFRVAQEALANVRKHAGSDRIRLSLVRRGETVRLAVQDWGGGFSAAPRTGDGGPGERVGISSMRERVALLGGDLQIRSRPGRGTAVIAEIPMAEHEMSPARDAALSTDGTGSTPAYRALKSY